MRRNDRRARVEAKHMLPPPEPDWTCPNCGAPLYEMCRECNDEVDGWLWAVDGETQERRTRG